VIAEQSPVLNEQRHVIDEQRHMIDEQRHVIDDQGRVIDDQGHVIAKKGSKTAISMPPRAIRLICPAFSPFANADGFRVKTRFCDALPAAKL
jgi:hypothetical protein